MQTDKLLTVVALGLSSSAMYIFVYLQCKQALNTLLIPYLPLSAEHKATETKGYLTLLNLVYFIFVVNAVVHAVEELAGLQIATSLKGLQTWADITGSQLFWLGGLVIGFMATVFILKAVFSDQRDRAKATREPW